MNELFPYMDKKIAEISFEIVILFLLAVEA